MLQRAAIPSLQASVRLNNDINNESTFAEVCTIGVPRSIPVGGGRRSARLSRDVADRFRDDFSVADRVINASECGVFSRNVTLIANDERKNGGARIIGALWRIVTAAIYFLLVKGEEKGFRFYMIYSDGERISIIYSFIFSRVKKKNTH